MIRVKGQSHWFTGAILMVLLVATGAAWEWLRAANEPVAPGLLTLAVVALALGVFADRLWQARRRQEVQSLVERTQERLQLAAKATNDAIWDWEIETETGWFNDAYVMLFGRPESDELSVRVWWESRIHAEDRHRVVEGLERALKGDATAWSAEYRVRLRDGSHADVLDRTFIARDENGNARRILGAMFDLTERKEIQRALAQAADEAEAATESKTEFLANMSHEIRTPMTAILGYTDLLNDLREDTGEYEGAVAAIRRSGQGLLSIIDDILDLSKIQAGRIRIDKSVLSVRQVVSETISIMRVRAVGKNLDLAVDFDGEIPMTIHSDPVRLRQILINLVGNAIKFTDSGSVVLRISLVDAEREPMLAFEVIDTGIGMRHDQVAQLFRPFVQAETGTTRQFGGAGLGLTISRRLARMLGGDITVDAEEGAGSSFQATVTTGSLRGVEMITGADEVSPAPVPPPPGLTDEKPLDGWRVLLVEDGPDNQRLIRFHVTKMGATVVVAENGLEGKEKALGAAEDGEPYNLILMDMQMPVMDGYQATRELRLARYDGAIVALTAHAMTGDRERCLAAGCDEYATKPIDRAALLQAIRRARALRITAA